MGELFEQNRDKYVVYNMEFWGEENAFPPQAYTYNEQSLPASMTSSFSSHYSGDAGSSPDHFSLLEGMMSKGEEYGYFPPETEAPTISFETTQTYISSDENCSSAGASPGSVKIVRGEPMCQQAVHPQPVYEVHVQKEQQSIDNWIDEMVVGSDSSSNSPPPPRKRAKVTFSSNSSDTSASSPLSTVTSQSTDPRKERRKETNRKASQNYRKKQESRKSTKEKNLAVEKQEKQELERENYAIKQNLNLMLKLFSTAAVKYQN